MRDKPTLPPLLGTVRGCDIPCQVPCQQHRVAQLCPVPAGPRSPCTGAGTAGGAPPGPPPGRAGAGHQGSAGGSRQHCAQPTAALQAAWRQRPGDPQDPGHPLCPWHSPHCPLARSKWKIPDLGRRHGSGWSQHGVHILARCWVPRGTHLRLEQALSPRRKGLCHQPTNTTPQSSGDHRACATARLVPQPWAGPARALPAPCPDLARGEVLRDALQH